MQRQPIPSLRISFRLAARLIAISLAFAWPYESYAQSISGSNWQDVRNHQPAALHLKLILPKDHVFQGEKIDATLEFSNDDATRFYSVAVGTATPGAVFHAFDQNGSGVEKGYGSSEAAELLKSEQWHYSAEERRRLQMLASAGQSK